MQRPQLLTVLCILTFIATGLSIIGAFVVPATADTLVAFMKAAPGFDAQRDADQITIVQAGWAYYMTMCGLNLLVLLGALMMWRLKKNGFHIYTLSNVIAFYLPILWLKMPFNILGAMVTAGFIGLYAVNLRFMK